MRYWMLLVLAVLASCAHGHRKCDEFSFRDPACDLDGSGTITTADYGIWLKAQGG